MRYTILVIEDTRDTRELIKVILELEGYRVLEAVNGFDGLEMARRNRPDAIVLDMSLPLMDGYKATKRLRREPGLTTVPIIACTAYNRWEWHGKAIAAGCTHFLTKPLEPKALVAVLARYLQ